LFKYRDVNGKERWSCICSAMNWITVAMEYIAAGFVWVTGWILIYKIEQGFKG